MVRKIGGPIAGAVIAMVGIRLLRWLIDYAFGPAGIDPGDDMAAYIQAMEAGAFVGLALSTFVGTLFGAFVGARIAKDIIAAWAVAGVVLIWTIFRVVTVPHPLPFILASVALIALAGWLAGVLAGRGGFEDDEEGDELSASDPAPVHAPPVYEAPAEPEARGWPDQGYDDPEPDIFGPEPDPEPQPERPRWTPLPPRSED